MNRTTLIEQLRKVVSQQIQASLAHPTVTSTATIHSVNTRTVNIISSQSGALIPNVGVAGGVQGLAAGDTLTVLHLSDGNVLGLASKGQTAGGPISAPLEHTHADLYLDRGGFAGQLAQKSDLGHSHPLPDELIANHGVIASWNIGDLELTAPGTRLGAFGFLGLGPAAAVPNTFGNFPGVFLGYDSVGDQAQLMLYKDASNFFKWTGTQLIIQTPHLVLDASGNLTLTGTITATAGAIGGWVIGTHTLTGGLVVLTDSGLIQGNYVAGLSGYQLTPTGNAEFNNVTARGEFRASVFAIDEQHAIGGSQIVLPAAGLQAQVTTQ